MYYSTTERENVTINKYQIKSDKALLLDTFHLPHLSYQIIQTKKQ